MPFSNKISSGTRQILLMHAATNPADTNVLYYGGGYTAVATTAGADYHKQIVTTAGTIIRAYVHVQLFGTNGTTEDSTLELLKNGSSVATLTSTMKNNNVTYTNDVTGLNIPIAVGDVLQIKWTCPTWVTNPTAVVSKITLDVV